MRGSALSADEMEANHARFYQVNRVAGHLSSEPQTANRDAVQQLVAGRLITYRGRLYFAPPIPYTAGLRHQHLLEELQRAAAGDRALEPGVVSRCLRLFHQHLRPVAWWGFLPWWTRRNPFRAASAREIGELNASFLVARMT
jgi:hypothetical protein